MGDKFYTVDQLAEMWELHRSTIINLILKQKLSATVIGKQYRISQEQLDEYYRANTISMKDGSE